MNALQRQAQYMQGVREEFLRNGYSEADARSLTKLAFYKQARDLDADAFDYGFYERIGRRMSSRLRRKAFMDRVMDALPWILGIGAAGAIVGTPWGHRRLRDLFGSEELMRERNAKTTKPFQTDYGKNESNTEGSGE